MSAVPVFDLFGLLLVFFLLGPSLLSQSGIRVEMPVSKFHVPQENDVAVITMTPGDPPVLWLDQEQLTEADLIATLSAEKSEEGRAPAIYVRTDGAVDSRDERRIAEKALTLGYRVYLLGGQGDETNE